MAEPTIVLRSPVKPVTSSIQCLSPNSSLNSPTHNSTVIILKDNNNNDQQQQSSTTTIKNSIDNQSLFSSLKSVQSKLYYAGYTGLYNLGNTCYVNCVLQLLSHVPQFCDAICSMSFESLGLEQPSDVPMVASSHNPTRLKGGSRGLLKALEAQPRRVPCYLAYELHGTFNIIWSGKCMVYSPLNMIAAVRRLLPSFEPCAMEDAQEFLEALLSAVTDEIKANKLADTNIINDLLGFSSESQILCEQCHRLSVTKTDETFITLTFSEKMLCDVRGSSRRRSCHLTEMLAHFYQWEALSTPFHCSNCTVRSPSKEGTKAQKRLIISKLPQVLHVVLRRFRSLPQTTLRRPTSRQARQLSHKITLHVNFDEYLDMAPYCTQSTLKSISSTCSKLNGTTTNECLYRLRGVIVHYGKSINTGHFVAFVYNDVLGEWLRCDDHIIEQTTFESVKTSDAYILVYSRCMTNTVSSTILTNPSITSMTCQLAKRKRAISVDNLNESKDDLLISENMNEMNIKQDKSDQHSDVTKHLKLFCLNLDPLASGLRRRAHSLNFSIRSSQPSVDNTRQNTLILPAAKRRRIEPINNLSLSENNSSSLSQQIIQTRTKISSTVNNNDSSVIPPKTKKSTRRRRRTDPYTRKRRMTKTSNRKNRHKIDVSNLVPLPSIDQTISTESLLSSGCSPLSFTYENTNDPNIPVTKRVGRIRIQRCINGPTTTTQSTVRLITSGETNTRLSLPSQPTIQSSSFLTSLITMATTTTTTSTTTTGKSSVTLSLHPLVIMNIAEHHTRIRVQTSQVKPVYGALLGKIKGRHIELCNTFEFKLLNDTTSTSTTSNVTIDMDFLTKKLELIRQVHPDLDFTGWYTVESKDWNPSTMSSFYAQLCSLNESPLLLRLDPIGVSNELPIHVYETIVDLGTKIDFIEIPYTLITEEAERIGIDHVARYSVTDGTSDTSIVSDQIAIQYNAIRLLYQRMLILLEYVRAVKQGQLERNDDLLREIGSLCQRLPIINTDDNNNQMFREDFDIQQSDVALLALLACCTQEISTLNDYLNKFQVVHDKQQHSSGPGGSFGYGGGGRRMVRGTGYFPASFV
ncbi:unnamed protein product [Rotaria sp. Silwood1]|nr:unnamed protein product [Rotaria sp. Silwood1]CAF3457958.1 unnamed protein product [Rotaria sp. Silwood1]CAF3465160.1 unnamed protein product [Rotaria sp. Silwood1]CAF4521029.1 unnamed protein product [Rotaria sp. Silwood1]CAF4607890.1 unnamed protein product [Rotaria sp. Silwood1]